MYTRSTHLFNVARWLVKNGWLYCGLCLSQLPFSPFLPLGFGGQYIMELYVARHNVCIVASRDITVLLNSGIRKGVEREGECPF